MIAKVNTCLQRPCKLSTETMLNDGLFVPIYPQSCYAVLTDAECIPQRLREVVPTVGNCLQRNQPQNCWYKQHLFEPENAYPNICYCLRESSTAHQMNLRISRANAPRTLCRILPVCPWQRNGNQQSFRSWISALQSQVSTAWVVTFSSALMPDLCCCHRCWKPQVHVWMVHRSCSHGFVW